MRMKVQCQFTAGQRNDLLQLRRAILVDARDRVSTSDSPGGLLWMSSSGDADRDQPERSAADDLRYGLGASSFVGEMNP